jgi:putative FmdB family regulatory protein
LEGDVPLYEYQCGRCGRFEVIRKFADAPLTACPTCGQEIQKLLSAPAIQFKGTGWYITDYARKSSGGGEGAKGASGGDGAKAASGGDGNATKDGGKDKGDAKSKASAATGSSDTSSSAKGSGSGSTS